MLWSTESRVPQLLSPYAMAEWSTKALASKAFLVNHAEFEAIVSLRKDNFHKI